MASGAGTQQLVGRGTALAALRACTDAAAGRRGRLLLVTGEAGIGKTALLREVAAEAERGGALVVWSQCWDSDGAPAYWPWVQVVRAAAGAGVDVGAAAVLLPGHAAAGPPAATAAEARFALFDAVVSALGHLAARRLVLVVVDDLHWADDGSLRLLEFAARHLAAQRVGLLGAYRDDEAGTGLRELAAMSELLPLGGLAAADVAALMAALTGVPPADAVAADVWRRTGGNPLLARELTRLLAAQPGSRQDTPPSRQLLATAGDILERRLARLSQHCVHLLTIAAVAGPAVRPELLRRLVDEPAGIPGLLDEGVQAGVLAPLASPVGAYGFSHDLFRETILHGLPATRRTQLHLAVGRALESAGREGAVVHPSEIASHFAAAMAAAPAEAVRYAVLAAEHATSRLAHDEARDHWERALAALELTDAGPADRLELLLRVGAARHGAGDAGQAHAAYRDAAELARRLGRVEALARAAIGVHGLGWRSAHAASITLLEEALTSLAADPTPLRARLLAALARDLHHSAEEQDWERAAELALEAVAVAEQCDDPRTLGFALLALHDARWRPGTAVERLEIAAQMLQAGSQGQDADLVAQARLLRATALIELGRPEGPAELDAYCRDCEQLGHARARYGAVTRAGTAAVIAGDLHAATTYATDGLALGEAIGEPDARGVYETLLWAVSFARGSMRTSGPGLDSNPWPGVPLLEAFLAVVRGDLPTARGALRRLRLEDLPRTHDLEVLTFAAEAVAAAGTQAQRSQVYEQLLPHAGTHVVVGGCASYFGAVDHHLGLLARALGRDADAASHLAAAAALHERLGAPAFAERSRADEEAVRRQAAAGQAVLRRDGEVWMVAFRGVEAHLPDSKGLRDLAVLLSRPGEPVHAVQLHTGSPPRTGADEVLDDRARAAYRRRLAELEEEAAQAEALHDLHRAERARDEREAIAAHLSAAVGLAGRSRRLGDEGERARKAVTARLRDAIRKVGEVNPPLGRHLSGGVSTGTWCCYAPDEPVDWRL